MLSQRMRPQRQVEVVILMKLVHPLIVADDIDRLKSIIMLCYFYIQELFLLLLLL
jgi:hypothetical protein